MQFGLHELKKGEVWFFLIMAFYSNKGFFTVFLRVGFFTVMATCCLKWKLKVIYE